MDPSSRITIGTKPGYDRWAEVYDGEGNPLVALEEARVAELVGDARSLRVVDVGCGTGRHAVRLTAAGADVTAVDFSDGMLAQAKKKPGAERVRFVVHDVTTPLPFSDRAFDCALACLVADHVPDLGAFLGDLGRGAP